MAKNKIFVLEGTGGCGKTSTIKNVLFLLMEEYHKTMKINSFKISADCDDITAQIVINGLLIGIETEGDPKSSLVSSLKVFDKANCDIIFCPSRTRGMTSRWINSHGPKYEIISHKQIIVAKGSSTRWRSKQCESNLDMAEKLIKAAGLVCKHRIKRS